MLKNLHKKYLLTNHWGIPRYPMKHYTSSKSRDENIFTPPHTHNHRNHHDHHHQSLSVYLSFSSSPPLSLCRSPVLSLSLSPVLSISLSLAFSLFLFLSLSFIRLSLFFYLSHFPSFSHSLHLSPPSLSLSFFISVSITSFRFPSLFLSLSLHFCLTFFLFFLF